MNDSLTTLKPKVCKGAYKNMECRYGLTIDYWELSVVLLPRRTSSKLPSLHIPLFNVYMFTTIKYSEMSFPLCIT